MTRARSLVWLLVTSAATMAAFWILLHQISAVWLDVALHPEVRAALERSLDDQKQLRALDPAQRENYRARFNETRRLLNRMEVIRLNREAMLRRFELALLGVFAIALLAAAVVTWRRHRRMQDASRREFLERVAALQETARRHAHEIKGPLTAARLELDRLGELARSGGDVAEAQESVAQELTRLARFTTEFSQFGGLGEPVLRRESLAALLDEFCATFANAWNGVTLRVTEPSHASVCADRDMIRQVLINLCTNAARAGAQSIAFTIGRNTVDVRDDGGGIAESLRARIFDPYVTTRKIGEGMGLGLSISRKILLDHGGDLVLAETSPSGTVFRLIFRELTC
ncbi:MAG TPA: ATP-binding protein [Thermoanaerobaculia bacterium]|nr:ATP-binding protein [Thermoanaerobaculia bacterium]